MSILSLKAVNLIIDSNERFNRSTGNTHRDGRVSAFLVKSLLPEYYLEITKDDKILMDFQKILPFSSFIMYKQYELFP